MNIIIPEAQFKRTFPTTLMGQWRRAFLRTVTKVMILHDRTTIAQDDPTKHNITRAVIQGIRVGGDMQYYAKIDKNLVHPKKFPKDWDTLVADEMGRIIDEEELADKETV